MTTVAVGRIFILEQGGFAMGIDERSKSNGCDDPDEARKGVEETHERPTKADHVVPQHKRPLD